MNGRQVLSRACQGVLQLLLLTAALGCLAVAYIPDMRMRLINFLLQDFEQFTDIGGGLLLLCILLRFGCIAPWRGSWLRVRMGRHLTQVDSELIRKTLEEKMACKVSRVFVSGGRLEIQIPPIPDPKEWLAKAEIVLIPFLRDRFGYTDSFVVSVSQN